MKEGLDHRRFQALLQHRRRGLLQRLRNIERWGLEDAETGGIGELSLCDQHPADLGAELHARQVDVGLQQNMERMLEQIDKALKRIEEGRYGACEDCGRPIDKARLDAMPYVTRCVACQERVDGSFQGEDGVNGARPPEEASLEPPFGRTFRDDADDVVYDGEDAWQDVARYGTANTPQDVPPAVEYDEVYVDADEDRGIVSFVDGVQDIGSEGVQRPEIYPEPEDGEDDEGTPF